jgi:hypothetical protein
MRRTARALFAFAALALLASSPIVAAPSSDAALDAPPPNLLPSVAHLPKILSAHEKAVGTPTPGLRDTAIEQWSFTDAGAAGTEHLTRAGSNYRSRITRGPFVVERGQLDGKRWQRDLNGIVTPTTLREADSFFAQRVLEDAADPKNDVSVAGEIGGPQPCYVLKVTLSGEKHPSWYFYDKATAMIVRVERVMDGRRVTSTYSDFRRAGGIMRFWHIHDDFGSEGISDDWTRISLQVGVPVDAAQFAQPASSGTFFGLGGTAQIPVHTFGGAFVLRVNIKGRGLDFLLDPATPDSIVDYTVAKELGLPTYGQTTQLPDGTPYSYDTVLPDATVGPVRLSHFAVRAENYAYDIGDSTKIVGVLGYDFLATNNFKVDFVDGTLEVMPPGQLPPIANHIELPLVVDGGIPLVSAGMGSDFSSRVVFAQASPISIVFGSYYDAHRAAFTDLEGHALHDASIPFASEGTYGTHFQVWIARLSLLHFAAGDEQQKVLLVTDLPLHHDGDPIDAEIGYRTLRYYDIYYAYPTGQIVVAPNKWFFAEFQQKSP